MSRTINLTFSRTSAVVIAGILLVAILGVIKATPAYAYSCSGKVNNIHWGTISGNRSIKFVGQVSCNANQSSITISTVLWYCNGQRPENNKSWLDGHCSGYTNNRVVDASKANVVYKLSSPKPGTTATRTGWYTATLDWLVLDYQGGGLSRTNFGTPVNCTSSTCS